MRYRLPSVSNAITALVHCLLRMGHVTGDGNGKETRERGRERYWAIIGVLLQFNNNHRTGAVWYMSGLCNVDVMPIAPGGRCPCVHESRARKKTFTSLPEQYFYLPVGARRSCCPVEGFDVPRWLQKLKHKFWTDSPYVSKLTNNCTTTTS